MCWNDFKTCRFGRLSLLTLFLTFGFGFKVQAASIDRCFEKTSRCIIKLQKPELKSVLVGARSFVTDGQARPVARGWVVKAKGRFAVVTVQSGLRGIERGSPVIIQKVQKPKPDLKDKPKTSRYSPLALVPVNA